MLLKNGCSKVVPIIFLSLFWIFVLAVLLVNYWNSGSIYTGNNNHDFHWSFITYLAGMASLGYLPGVDFLSTHGTFVPFFQGLFMGIVGVSQINMAISTGIMVFVSFVFIYKTSRFVLNAFWSCGAIFIILLSYTGREVPWFNDVLMVFVSIAVYFFASYVDKDKNYKLIIVGVIASAIPYMRQQAIVISFMFFLLPLCAYYFGLFKKEQLKRTLLLIIGAFLAFQVLFLLFVTISGQGSVLFDSFFRLVSRAIPTSALQPTIMQVLPVLTKSLFNYSIPTGDFYGSAPGFLQYWLLFIIVAVYFIIRAFNANSIPNSVTKADFIRFVCACCMLSTIILNFPINEEIRSKAHFSIGVWLLMDAAILAFYDSRKKILGVISVIIVLVLMNYGRLPFAYDKLTQNINRVGFNKEKLVKMPNNSAFAGMLFTKEKSASFLEAIDALRLAEKRFPNSPVIFNGNMYDAGAYVYLYFSADKKGLQHSQPWYFHAPFLDRDYSVAYQDYLQAFKPIIIDCSSAPLPDGFELFYKTRETSCLIAVLKNS